MARPRILCVDDDAQLLGGLSRTLGRNFEVHTETDAEHALERLRGSEKFSVVMSDMQMPKMKGTDFLQRVKEICPDTVRILLTGHADMNTALSAVNDGYIFRLLLKPCPTGSLDLAITAAVEQYRLVTADRLLLEQKVDAISAQLLHSERLATLGTLACGVGHELNNMTAVFFSVLGGLKEAAAAGAAPDPNDLEDLARVAQHLKAHGRQLLDMGRPSREQPAPVDLGEVVRSTLAMLSTAGKTRRVAVEVTALEELVVEARRTQVEQVLVNLVINAVDAMAEHRERPARITVHLESRGNFAVCTVGDSGVGMAPEVQARIFEAFFTTKAPGKGTGLGLPVVKQIVEAHGGVLTVDSRPGEGTRFAFTLPLVAQA